MIKVLHIVSALNTGGVERMLYNYYKHIDRSKIKFDFIVHGKNVGILENELLSLGSKVYHVTPKNISVSNNIREISKLINNGDYNIVHCHQNFSNFSSLFLAKIHKVPIRISHSHGYKKQITKNQKMKQGIYRYLNNTFANYFFSCGEDAGNYLHGDRWRKKRGTFLMKNAIDLQRFSFDINDRTNYRKSLDVDNKLVLLHVGRFSNEKNHEFILEILSSILEKRKDIFLFLIGSGEKEEEIKKLVAQKKLKNYVKFLGVRDDVAKMMSSSDIFIFPSKNEGLGITTIEAQANGLQVLASDAVPRDTNVTQLIKFLPLNNKEVWIEEIYSFERKYKREERVSIDSSLIKGYSIEEETLKYENWLRNVVNESI